MCIRDRDYTIGQYLDISLFKYMTVNGNRQPGAALHTTKNALPISVVVPDALIHTDSAVNRNYCIVRCHEGAIAVLDAAFDAANKTLTFKTDRFSVYAIAYKDTAVPSSGSNPGSNNSSNDSETKKNEVAAPTPAPTPASTSKPSTITADVYKRQGQDCREEAAFSPRGPVKTASGRSRIFT